MKITEKQLHILMIVLKDSVRKNIVGMFDMPYEDRVSLFNEIINQQDDELVDVKGDEQIES